MLFQISAFNKKMTSQQNLERNQIACLACKKSKRKCDRRLPTCNLCIGKNKPCIYPREDKRKPATYNYIKTLLNRIQTLETSLSYYTSTSLPDSDAEFRSSDRGNIYSGLVASRLADKKIIEAERALLPVKDKLWGKEELSLYELFLDNQIEVPQNLQQSDSPKEKHALLPLPSQASCSVNEYIFPQWQLIMSDNEEISFQGPTSLRFIAPSDGCRNVKYIKPVDEVEFFDEFHPLVFSWFFKCIANSFPLIDKQLFFTSLNQAIKGDDLGKYSPMTLINAIVSMYFLYKGNFEEAQRYKKLSISQLSEQYEINVNITIAQTLILLSHISMLEGKEIESSEFIARSVAVVSHLGLHVNCGNLIYEGKVTLQEAQLRDNVLWCCYFTDRARVIILGMSPYMYPVDISIDLPKAPLTSIDIGFKEFDVFKEALIFQDLEFERAYYCFSSDFTFGFDCKSPESCRIEQELIVSKALIAITEWKKAMNSNARFNKNNAMVSMQLEVAVLSTTLLLNQTLLREPVKTLHAELDNQFDPQQLSITCFGTAKQIIDLCMSYDLTENLFLFRFIYSIYISCINFLFNKTSSNSEVRSMSLIYVVKSLNLLKTYKSSAPAVNMFVAHLDKFRKKWFENDANLAACFDSFQY